ncbi:MAG: hypothetical protein JEZ11_02220 [Desulfobacterales bacterium]|nr:hypothetical protein [Desulfobacterales bacterium]
MCKVKGACEPDKGTVNIGHAERIAVLKQDPFAVEEQTVINSVIMGHGPLYAIMMERDACYAKIVKPQTFVKSTAVR